jgi:hypothetical protein
MPKPLELVLGGESPRGKKGVRGGGGICIIYCMVSNLIISCQILVDDDVNQNKFK